MNVSSKITDYFFFNVALLSACMSIYLVESVSM